MECPILAAPQLSTQYQESQRAAGWGIEQSSTALHKRSTNSNTGNSASLDRRSNPWGATNSKGHGFSRAITTTNVSGL